MFTKYFKFAAYLFLAIFFSSAKAGAYDDFFRAAMFDDARGADALLARGFDPNSRDEKGQVALFLCMREGSFKTAEVLLASPQLRIDLTNAAGETALMMAALKGHADWVRRLLDRGARLDGLAQPGWTPLHYAASGPEPKTVALLLERGARVDVLSPNGSTPLMMAARYGAESSVNLLLAKGADARLRNERELDAADFARGAGREALAAQLAQAAGR
jgi:hypothetical protein